MRLIKWKPEPVKIDNEFDSMINKIFNEEWDLPLKERNNWIPDMDVKETDTSLIIKADVAGLTKKNIQVKKSITCTHIRIVTIRKLSKATT